MAKNIKTPKSAGEDGPKEISKEDLDAIEGGKTLSLTTLGEDQTRETILRRFSDTRAIGAASDEGL